MGMPEGDTVREDVALVIGMVLVVLFSLYVAGGAGYGRGWCVAQGYDDAVGWMWERPIRCQKTTVIIGDAP